MSNATTMSGVRPFNSFMDYTKLDRNRERTVPLYAKGIYLLIDALCIYLLQ